MRDRSERYRAWLCKMLALLKNAFYRIGMLPNRFGQPSTSGARIKVLRVEYIIDFAKNK